MDMTGNMELIGIDPLFPYIQKEYNLTQGLRNILKKTDKIIGFARLAK
ncbi:hypothetical protein [Flavobacterium muglaense]|uniref:Uncharacterized protein n=1 Tax=Flavobacterium muglaense TaxID=2764716 RepID=A0A923N623_9FLAO|nr:hypothetical protein [Flavobacterium muglaense]MBC5846263.1 hypothetical protein [Flavobacterium muglaense]